MASRRFKALQSRVTQIERRLLPKPDPLGVYTDSQYDRVRSYLVLAHAEVEACVEDLAWDVVDRVYTRYRTTGRIRVPLLALMAYYQGTIPPVQGSFLQPPKQPPPDLKARIAKVCADYRSRVQTNHGIKETNLIKLLIPIGVQDSNFPVGWLADMNTFGSDRGEVAHKAAIGSVRQPPDPVAKKRLVADVLVGLHVIDGVLRSLR